MKKVLLLSTAVIAQTLSHDWVYTVDSTGQKFIVPKELTPQVPYLSELMQIYSPMNKTSHQTKPLDFPIFFIHDSPNGNGFVHPIEKRSGFFGAPINLGNNTEWLQMLAVHEGNHMAQYTHLYNKGFLYNLFGPKGGAILGFFIPNWYFEGDAVWHETAFTKGGRGRSAYFMLPWRVYAFADSTPSYYRALFNSSHLPMLSSNSYSMGYLINTDIRERFGNDAPNQIINNLFTFTFDPFYSGATRSITKKSVNDNFNIAVRNWKKRWSDQYESNPKIPTETIEICKNLSSPTRWTSQIPLGFSQNLNWIYRSEEDEPMIYGCDSTGKIQQQFNIPQSSLLSLAYGVSKPALITKNHLFYLAKLTNPLHPDAGYSKLIQLDLLTKNKSKINIPELTEEFALDYDEQNLATVEWSSSHQQKIKIYSFPQMNVIDSLFINSKRSVGEIQLSGQRLIYVTTGTAGNSIHTYQIKSKEHQTIIEPTLEEAFMQVNVRGDSVIFQSDYSGINAIHYINLSNHERKILGHEKIGLTHPVFGFNQQILASQWGNRDGNRIVKMNLDKSQPLLNYRSQKIDPWFGKIDSQITLHVDQNQKRLLAQIDSPGDTNQLKFYNYNPILALRPNSWLVYPKINEKKLDLSINFNDALMANELVLAAHLQKQNKQLLGNYLLEYSYHFSLPKISSSFQFGDFYNEYSNQSSTTQNTDTSLQKSVYQFKKTSIKIGLGIPIYFDLANNWSISTGSNFNGSIDQIGQLKIIANPLNKDSLNLYEGIKQSIELRSYFNISKSGSPYIELPKYAFITSANYAVDPVHKQDYLYGIDGKIVMGFWTRDRFIFTGTAIHENSKWLSSDLSTQPLDQNIPKVKNSSLLTFSYETAPWMIERPFPGLNRLIYLSKLTPVLTLQRWDQWENYQSLKNILIQGAYLKLNHNLFSLQAIPFEFRLGTLTNNSKKWHPYIDFHAQGSF